jgi:hypothetical protein
MLRYIMLCSYFITLRCLCHSILEPHMNQSFTPELQVQLGLRQGNGEHYHGETWPSIGQTYLDRNIQIQLIKLCHNTTNSDVAIYHAVLLLYHSQMLVSFFRRNQLNHPAPRNPIHRGPPGHCLAPRTHIHSVMYFTASAG